MFLPNLSLSSLMQTAGTSPAYRYSSSAPDTILRPYLHTNEPFQNNFSNLFGTNRLFSDMPVQQHLLLIARVFFYTQPQGNLPLPLCRNASDKLSSLPASEQGRSAGVCHVRLWGLILGRVCAPNAPVAAGLQVALNPSLCRLVPQFPSLEHGNDAGLLSEVF